MKTRKGSEMNWEARYGSWALITGASDGIGQAFAYGAAARGLNVVLVARREKRLHEVASELERTHKVNTLVIAADLARREEVERVIDQSGSLDIGLLIASAGFGTTGRLIDADVRDEFDMLAVNSGAVLRMVHEFGGRFARQQRGGIILMSSLVAFQGVPLSANYAATKAYVQSLAEGIARELSPLGVDVIASAPGPVRSGFAARAQMRMSMAASPAVVADETLNALGRRSFVRPGLLAKFLQGSLSFLPRSRRIWAMERIMRDMTRHQPPAVT